MPTSPRVPGLRRVGALRGICLALAVGCGGADGLGDDGGSAGDAQDAGDAAYPALDIAEPALPLLTPCPAGWQEVHEGDVVTCEPFPAGVHECGSGEVQFAGELGCVPIGDACPAGRFPEPATLPTDQPLLFVDPSGPPGRGTRDDPFNSLPVAASAAEPGSLLVLASGDYSRQVVVPVDMEIRGACAAEVKLASPAGRVVSLEPGVSARLSNLSLGSGLSNTPLFVPRGSSAQLSGVEIAGSQGIEVYGSLSGESVAFRGIVGTSPVAGLGSVSLSRVVFEHSPPVAVSPGPELTLEDVVVRGGDGVEAASDDSASLQLRRAVIQDVPCRGLLALGLGTAVAAEELLVRDVTPCSNRELGAGIAVQLGAQMDLRRAQVQDAHSLGIQLLEGSSAVISDAVVRSIGLASSDDFGVGVALLRAGTARITRLHLDRTETFALAVVGGEAEAEDVTVVDTRSHGATGTGGWAVGVTQVADVEGRLTVRRGRFARNREVGVASAYGGALVELRDVRILDTAPAACEQSGCPGRGAGTAALALDGGSLDLQNFELRGGPLCGLHLRDATARIRDGVVAGFRIALCASGARFEPTAYERGVSYYGNDVSLRTTELPVPDAAAALVTLGGAE